MRGDRLAGIREYDLYRYYREREAREREEKAKEEKVALFFERELRRLIPQEKFDEELARKLIAEEMDLARELLLSSEPPRSKVEKLLEKGISDRKERLSEIEHKLAKFERVREKGEETLKRWSPEGTLFKETVREFRARFPEGFGWHHLTDEVMVEVDFETLRKLVERSIREKVEEGLERYGGEKRFLEALEGEPDPYVDELKESPLCRPIVEELERCKAKTGFFARLAGKYKELDFDHLLARKPGYYPGGIWGVKPFKKIYWDHSDHEGRNRAREREHRTTYPFKVEVGRLMRICDDAFLGYDPLEREGAVNPRSYDHLNPLVLFERHWIEGKSLGDFASDKVFERWEIPKNPTIAARRTLQYIRENEDRLDRLKAEKRGVRREIEGLEETRKAMEETKEIVETGETAETEQLETPPSIEEEAKQKEAEEREKTPLERYEIGKYVILHDEECYHVSRGDQEIGSFAEGKVLVDENRALFELDKGMLLEVTPEGHREIFSKEKASLDGAIKADGTLRCGGYWEKYQGKWRWHYKYEIRLCEPDPAVRAIFGKNLKRVYNIKAHDYPTREEVHGYGKDMAYDIAKYGPINTHGWRVPFEHLDKEGAREWLRGYFNGDGSCSEDIVNRSVRVVAVSVNRRGLEDVQALLKDQFGIRSGIYPFGPKERPEGQSQTYRLQMGMREGVIKFRDEIGFDGPKQQKLSRLIRKYWGE